MTRCENILRRNSAQLGLLAVTIAFWVVFARLRHRLPSDFNLFTLLRFAAVQITIAFGQMIALSAGEMNLSLGAIGGAVAMCAGGLMEMLHLDPLLAIPIALALGALMGALNGFLTVRTGINSFVITLATASVYTGLMLAITQADSYDDLPEAFLTFSRIRVMGYPGVAAGAGHAGRGRGRCGCSTTRPGWGARSSRSAPIVGRRRCPASTSA